MTDKHLIVADVFKDLENGATLKEKVDEIEAAIILVALKNANNNKSKASRVLRINRTTLVEKCKRLGLSHVDVQ